MKPIHERMFAKLQRLGILDERSGTLTLKEHIRIENPPYMPLSIDVLRIEENAYHIALAHNYIQNGDVMADPDMEISIYYRIGLCEAKSYQQDSLGIYQVVYPSPGMVDLKAKKELNIFLDRWLSNLIEQGFYLRPREIVEEPEKAMVPV